MLQALSSDINPIKVAHFQFTNLKNCSRYMSEIFKKIKK